MKKKVLIVVSVLLALMVIVGILVFAFTRKPDIATTQAEQTEKLEQLEQKIFFASNFDDIDKIVKDEELNVFYSDDKMVASIIEFDFWDSIAEMDIYFDNNKNIESFNIYIPLCNISELSTDNGKIEDQVYNVCRETINLFSELFNMQYTQDIQLSNYDGTFSDVKSANDITNLINKESYINFAVRDKNGYYYVMHISVFESTLETEIKKYFDVDEYKDYVANISLYEGE